MTASRETAAAGPAASRSNSRSAQLYERALKVLPGGTSRQSTYMSPFPIYAGSGTGARVVDVDGVERIDFNNNYTALIFGYGHPEIERAVVEQAKKGTAFSLATEKEIELAEIVCARVESIDKVRFVNSGTEAVMWAVKAARGFTGRPKIAKCEGAFHGSYDYMEVSYEPSPDDWGAEDRPARVAYAKGTPAGVLEDVVVIPFNDTGAAERILDAHRSELAGVVIDPIANRLGMISARPEFLAMLRDFCTRSGAVFISDEVLSFRLGYGGAQAEFGYAPDLTVLAKTIGGGFPVGAVGGREKYMAVFDPTRGKPAVPQSGTFSGNPITMAAGVAGMKLLTPEVFERLNALGERARRDLRQAIAGAGVAAQVTGRGSLFRIHLHERTLAGYRSQYPTKEEKARLAQLYEYLFDHGILLATTGMGALTLPMTDSDVDEMVDAVAKGLKTLKA